MLFIIYFIKKNMFFIFSCNLLNLNFLSFLNKSDLIVS